jgi:sulfur-oxidizing protein SoxY
MNQRRVFITSLTALTLSPWQSTSATSSDAMQAMKAIVGNHPANTGRIYFELPPLVENGNLVAIKFSVQSPMTQNDYVKAIHIIAEANPLPNVVSCYFTPLSGKAEASTRIRLADSQKVWALAQMSDGSFWRTSVDTVVTLSACTEMI